MTGGDVAMSTAAEHVIVAGRVSTAQAKVAPASGAGKWTVTSGGTGVANIVFTESYAEFLGCTATVEGSTAGYAVVTSFTASTKTLVITTYQASDDTAHNLAFAFTANFTESKAP